jgi:hypothetical protein
VTGSFNGPPAYNYVPRCDNKVRPSVIQIVTGFHLVLVAAGRLLLGG